MLLEDELEAMRQQFDTSPYPRIPLEKSPAQDLNRLYIHNFVTPYYLRNQTLPNQQPLMILDAGCGSGYTTLTLALANPTAQIIGIDLSAASVDLARKRLHYHGCDRVEFYALAIEDLPSLGMQFDYINSDEVLYLLPDIQAGLRAMRDVLKPSGIIRTNLHNFYQRQGYFRAQQVSALLGLMDRAAQDFEIKTIREFMAALKDDTNLKAIAWSPKLDEEEDAVRANYLLQGDRGFTVPQMFAALEAADLEFISMVQWRQWELLDLFKNPDALPDFLELGLLNATTADKLHLFELLHPIHRLLDFWCGHVGQGQENPLIAAWSDAEFCQAIVHLHPQLQGESVRSALIHGIQAGGLVDFTQVLSAPVVKGLPIPGLVAACLLPLWQQPQPVSVLVKRYQTLQPIDPITLEPLTEAQALAAVRKVLTSLEMYLYVLLQKVGQ